MLKLVKYGSLILIFALCGYFLYPQLNKVDDLYTVTKRYQLASGLTCVENSETESLFTDKTYLKHSDVWFEERLLKSTFDSQDQRVASKTVFDTFDLTEDELDLKVWRFNYKEYLFLLLDRYVTYPTSENMKKAIMKENQMFKSHKLRQNPTADFHWAQQTEAAIYYYLEHHENGPGFELLSVQCKQLVCDIVGIEIESEAWKKIYRGFYVFPNIRYPRKDYQMTNVYRKSVGSTYIYAQVFFGENEMMEWH